MGDWGCCSYGVIDILDLQDGLDRTPGRATGTIPTCWKSATAA